MPRSNRTGRRVALLVAGLVVGFVVVTGGPSSVPGVGSDDSVVPGFSIDIPEPNVSLGDSGGDNGTSSPPGVSPLPVAPDPEPDRPGDDATTGYRHAVA